MEKLVVALLFLVSIYNCDAICDIITTTTVSHIKDHLGMVRKIQTCGGVEIWGYGGVYKNRKPVEEKLYNKTIDLEEAKISMADAENIMKKKYGQKADVKQCIRRIKIDHDENPQLVYQCSIVVTQKKEVINAFETVDAISGTITDSFVDLITVCNNPAGGNDIVGTYEYGKLQWSGRRIKENNDNKCSLENTLIEVRCQGESEDCDDCSDDCQSQINDAWFFTNSFINILKNRLQDTILKDWLKRDPVDPNKIKIYVMSDLMKGTAFFTEPANLFFGKGNSGDQIRPLAVPSIIGHELGHVYIAATCQLEYRGQSGAIAESFSDICGVLLQSSINDWEPDWDIGSEVILDGSIRRMDTPGADGVSIGHFDAYDLKNPPDVTHASGIYNKAFTLLVEESKWSLFEAFSLFLRAAKLYWKPLTDFSEGLCSLLSAARDLDLDEDDVSTAFAKVGVFCGCPKFGKWIPQTEEENGQRKMYCFKIVEDKVIWSEALRRCQMSGGQLACLPNENKYQKLNELLKYGTELWVGGEDFREENEWVWFPIDADIGNLQWLNRGDDNMPANNTDVNNCIALNKAHTTVFGFDPQPCDSKKGFVCELLS